MRYDDDRQDEPERIGELTPAERELEAALAGLQPAPAPAPARDAIAIAFDAGRDAARRQLARWRVACGALAAALVASVALVPLMRTDDGHNREVIALNQQSAPSRPVERTLSTSSSPEFATDRAAAVASTNDRAAPFGSPNYAALAMYFDLRDRVMTDGVQALPAPPPPPLPLRDARPVPTALSTPDDFARAWLAQPRRGRLNDLIGGRS